MGGDHRDHGHADHHDHGRDHDRDHGHDHGHDHDHGHGHDHGGGLLARVRELVTPHSHDTASRVDREMEGSAEGIRALKISLAGLGVTALLQAVVVLFTGSVALLGDTLHNVADALTAVPLWVAFRLGQRKPDRRHTYGYGRAEDLAGIVIVVAILASAVIAGYEAFGRLLDPEPVDHLWAVAGASVIGFAGNELVARYRMRVGEAIGSAALVADGKHARTDGITSLGVLAGAIGVGVGWDRADPVVGLLIAVVILVVLRGAARDIYRRLMDIIDPELVEQMADVARRVEGAHAVDDVRVRWIGHTLHGSLRVTVDEDLDVAAGHRIAEHVEHELLHEVARLTDVVVHIDPCGHRGEDPHPHTQAHR